jgi:hypothetical protein
MIALLQKYHNICGFEDFQNDVSLVLFHFYGYNRITSTPFSFSTG